MSGLVVERKPFSFHNRGMKRYCRKVCVTDVRFLEEAARKCIVSNKRRRGLVAWLAGVSGLDCERVARAIVREDEVFGQILRAVAERIRGEIQERRIELAPVRFRELTDGSSGKVRKIGCLSVHQHFLDHVAVLAMQDILRRVGEYQVACVPGRGPLFGARRVSRWLRDRGQRYYCKLDVRKCYESISPERLLVFFRERVANADLLYLLEVLLRQHGTGLCIGSYFSQHACNLFLSQVYHFASEGLARVRRSRRGGVKRVRLVQHVLFYADDFLLLGRNRRDVERAAEAVAEFCAFLGLSVKPGFAVRDLERVQHGRKGFIDMMGYRIHRGFLTIRRRVWRRARRALLRVAGQWRRGGRVLLSAAMRLGSYNGYVLHSESGRVVRRYGVDFLRRVCSDCISLAAVH